MKIPKETHRIYYSSCFEHFAPIWLALISPITLEQLIARRPPIQYQYKIRQSDRMKFILLGLRADSSTKAVMLSTSAMLELLVSNRTVANTRSNFRQDEETMIGRFMDWIECTTSMNLDSLQWSNSSLSTRIKFTIDTNWINYKLAECLIHECFSIDRYKSVVNVDWNGE
jgi:hypothetical protein